MQLPTKVVASAAALILVAGCWGSSQARTAPTDVAGGPPASTADRTAATPASSPGATPTVPAAAPSARTSDTVTEQVNTGAVPTCGVESSSPVIDPATVTAAGQLAPDTCVFAPGSIPSPGCKVGPLTVISAGVVQPSRADKAPKKADGGGGRWGGRNGAAICLGSYTDHSVWLSNDGQTVLVEAPPSPLIYAARTQLQRSSAVWGAVAADVARVVVKDAAHPHGVPAGLGRDVEQPGASPSARFFVQPVGAGPVTVTALDADGKIVDSAVIP